MGNHPATTGMGAQRAQLAVEPFDRENPRSLVNLVPESVRNAIENVPRDLLELSPKQLETMTHGKQWTVTEQRLRTAFWLEYARAQELGVNMHIANIWSGLCSSNHFYSKILVDKVKMAFILTQPLSYQIAVNDALMYGLERVRDILDLPLYDQDGEPLPKVAKVILDTVEMLDNRVKGAVVHKVEQKNVNMNFNAPAQAAPPESVEELDRRIRELETEGAVKKSGAQNVIDATGVVLDDVE